MFEIIKKYSDKAFPVALFIFCFIFLFLQLGNYPLIDVDETRYSAMAREMSEKGDWLTLYLNNSFFFEKPPLYFWLLASSYSFFGKVSEFTARFPVALLSSILVFATYYFGKKNLSKTFGFISALILLSSLEFIILGRLSILDMVLSVFVGLALYTGYAAFEAENKNKKYLWWSTYLLCAAAVLAKGLPGVILIFGVLGIYSIITGKLKELFAPVNILPGMVIFFLVALPWHVLMYKAHGMAFFNEYIIKHHFSRFIDSKEISRHEPFYFYYLTFLAGFFPWIFTFISFLVKSCRDIFSKTKILDFFKNMRNLDTEKRFLVFLFTYFIFIFTFFTCSSTKLVTYILPLFPAAALLTGYYWHGYIKNNQNKTGITVSTWILIIIMLLAPIAGFMLPDSLLDKIDPTFYRLRTIASVWLVVTSIMMIILLNKNKRSLLFLSQVIFMAGVLFIAVNYVFPVIYNAGQKNLVDYAKYAKTIPDSQLITFNYGVRPSVLFYYGKHVNIIIDENYQELAELISSNPNYFVIIRTNDTDYLAKKMDFSIIEKGRKYTLINNIKIK